ncbi:cytochrome P450 [Flagelloscypha sp. PMI_526]|nr:cytochrome P450 [Flagelloscypha sp. PMI_526]
MFLLDIVDRQTFLVVGALAILTSLLRWALQLRQVIASIGYHPGRRTFFSSNSLVSNVLPRIPWITSGKNFLWKGNFTTFQQFGWDIYISVSAWPSPEAIVHLASPTAIKEVTVNHAKWPKPLKIYKPMDFYGQNIVTTEGDEWKRQRKISAPAFTDRNNKFVWDETAEIMRDLFDNVWGSQETITCDHVGELTQAITLLIIASAAFGQKSNFTSHGVIPAGHKMAFKEAIDQVSKHTVLRTFVPTWCYRLTSKGRHVLRSFDELNLYILDMIKKRRSAEVKEERYDLLSGLLDANEEESKSAHGAKLTLTELIGNIFIFLIAGHETSANTLAWSFAMLALYPEEQDKLYKHVKTLMPDGHFPSYEEMPTFNHSLAVMYETLRVFPPVAAMPKSAGEDTFLMAANTTTGEKRAIPIPKDTTILITAPGLHQNPLYWEKPAEYRPERFLKPDWPREAFLPFNGGPRACLGRKFSETETVLILSLIIERYSIHITEEPQFAHETFEQKKARILDSSPGLTHQPVRLPITFKRRY